MSSTLAVRTGPRKPVLVGQRQMLCVIFAMLLIAPLSYAQRGTIQGSISDGVGNPVPGAHIILVDTPFGAASRPDGWYHIEDLPTGRYDLTASAIGYERQTVSVEIAPGAVVHIDFVLTEIALQSGEIVVTASRRERLAGEVAVSLTSVAPAEIDARNAVALDQVLQYVSGVQMLDNQVSIRGSSGFSFNTGSRVLLLIDGAPMLRPDINGIPFDAIPISQVRRIEVLKGPGSALYGGGALGGVINVITNDYPDKPETSFSAFAGAYQPVRYESWRRQWVDGDTPQPLAGVTGSHARSLGRDIGIWAHVAYRYDAGHLRLDTYENLQLYSKLTWRAAPDVRFTALGGLTRRRSDNFLFWNGASDPLNPGQLDIGRTGGSSGSDDNLINELSLLPTLTTVLSPTVLLTARGRVFGVLIQPLDESGNARPLSQGTAGVRYGGEVQVDWTPSSERIISIGGTADANAARSSYFNDNDALRQPEGGLFVQWEETGLGRFTVAAGARFDAYRVRQDRIESKLSPKVSASYRVADRWIVRGAYGGGFRAPSVMERFVSNSDYLPLVSNLDLRPETSRSYEVGVRGYPSVSSLSSVLDAALFWSDYGRLIEPTFVPAERAFQFVNLTRARIRGAEVTGTVTNDENRSSIQVGYTYLNARDLTSNMPLVFRSSHLLKIAGSTAIGRLRLGADFRFASEPERVDSDFAMFVKDAETMVPIRVLDVRGGIAWPGVDLMLHVKNAFDYYYVERPAILAPPRHVILQFSVHL